MVYFLAEALPPLRPSSPKVVLNIALSIALGTLLGIAAALLLEFVDRRVRTVEEVSELLGLPIFGVLPRPGGIGGYSGGRLSDLSPEGCSVGYRRRAGNHDGKVQNVNGNRPSVSPVVGVGGRRPKALLLDRGASAKSSASLRLLRSRATGRAT